MGNIDILYLTDNSLDTIGGAEESTKILLSEIKHDYSLGIIHPGNVSNPKPGVTYYPLTQQKRLKQVIKKPFSFIKYISKVRKIIRKEKPKVIHTQAQVSFFIVALLRKLKLISKEIQLIHTERGLYTKYSGFIKKIFQFFMRELNVLVTTTEFNMKYWKQAIQKANIHVDFKIIENTAGELFETYDSAKEREEDGKLVLGFAGRYADWKNWPLAVEISEKLNEVIGEKLIVHMAVGCLDDKAEKETHEMFERLSALLGDRFEGKINISLKEMDYFYYGLDVFILTSNYNTESFGRTLVEAMSRKTIVLTTNAGGSVEVVGNNKNVITSSNNFIERIIDLSSVKEVMILEKERNLLRAIEQYSLKNNRNKHHELYEHSLAINQYETWGA